MMRWDLAPLKTLFPPSPMLGPPFRLTMAYTGYCSLTTIYRALLTIWWKKEDAVHHNVDNVIETGSVIVAAATNGVAIVIFCGIVHVGVCCDDWHRPLSYAFHK